MAVYLIHFAERFRHTRHYLGYAADVAKRERRHRANRGARLLRALNRAGIGWDVVRTWPDGDKALERKLKRRKGSADLCPVCRKTSEKKRRAS